MRAADVSLGTVVRHTPLLLMLAGMLLFIFACGQRFGVLGTSVDLADSSLAASDGAREVEIFSVLPRDAIRSIDAPKFLTVQEAGEQMSPFETVLGFELDGEARAYPINMLSQHEIVNDEIGGLPIAVTYCPLCFTGIVYDRRVGGEVLEFGVSGKLVMNDLVMYDRETESLWQQILGEGIQGHFKGTRLTALPAMHTSWESWVALHPKTAVLDKEGDYGGDSYTGYYSSRDVGVIAGQTRGDPRFDAKELVLGVVAGDQPKAYAFQSLADEPVLNDEAGGLALVVAFDPISQTAVAFRRDVDGTTLTFQPAAGDRGPSVMRDVETASLWSALSGEAIDGPLAGTKLQQVAATYAFWFAWSDFYTQTQVYQTEP